MQVRHRIENRSKARTVALTTTATQMQSAGSAVWAIACIFLITWVISCSSSADGTTKDLNWAYRQLGITKNATFDEAKAAFRKEARRTHPDKNPGREEKAAAEFKIAKEAFEMVENKFNPKPVTLPGQDPNMHPEDVEFFRIKDTVRRHEEKLPTPNTWNPIKAISEQLGVARKDFLTLRESVQSDENRKLIGEALSQNLIQWINMYRDLVLDPKGLDTTIEFSTKRSSVALIKQLFGIELKASQINRNAIRDLIDHTVAIEILGVVNEMNSSDVFHGFQAAIVNKFDNRMDFVGFTARSNHRKLYLGKLVKFLLDRDDENTVVRIYEKIVSGIVNEANQGFPSAGFGSASGLPTGLMKPNEIEEMEEILPNILNKDLQKRFASAIESAQVAVALMPSQTLTKSNTGTQASMLEKLRSHSEHCKNIMLKVLRDGVF